MTQLWLIVHAAVSQTDENKHRGLHDNSLYEETNCV